MSIQHKRLTIFPAGDVEQGLLVGVLAHQPEDRHILALANAVASGHGLQVILQSNRYTFRPCRALLYVRVCVKLFVDT